jgi:hypothetical protein
MAYVMSGWMIDDSLAFRLQPEGWTRIAIERAAVWFAIALAFWAGIVFLNRLIMPRLGLNPRRGSFWLGLTAATCIFLCAVAGAIRFVHDKPFM